MNILHRPCALGHCGGDAFGRAEADISDREYSRHTCLEAHWLPGQGKSAQLNIAPRADKSFRLAGLRDPLVGRGADAAARSHAWTLEELPSGAAASRSALADRFIQIVGCPPIQYLTQWRMRIAAKRLADPGVKIAAVAHEVGYESGDAFSRAFKKFVGR